MLQITLDRIDRIDQDSLAGIDERAARRALRGQIARLERELAGIVADGFPHIAASVEAHPPGHLALAHDQVRSSPGVVGPTLLDLEGLERARDKLAGMVQSAGRARAERVELETSARELLEAMKREPARYKFVRLPVRALGEGGCGVWQVRPRLGLLGMLAGWWQVKLSSGCPLGQGPRARVAPANGLQPPRGHAKRDPSSRFQIVESPRASLAPGGPVSIIKGPFRRGPSRLKPAIEDLGACSDA